MANQRVTQAWQAGVAAARANLLPGLLVQVAMLALVAIYYSIPGWRPVFDRLGTWKRDWGYGFSALSAALAGGLLPEILRLLVFQKGRLGWKNASNLLFTIPYWAVQGMVVDLLYRWQAVWFGEQATFGIIARKVLVDQLIFNSLFAAPVAVICYDWKNNGVRCLPFGWRYYREKVLPALIATWGVWVPLVSIVYALPSTLQIPIFSLALTFWVMIFTWMSEAEQRPVPKQNWLGP